jgi:hypothetical protein
MARAMVLAARHGALAYLDADGAPGISRVALAPDGDALVTLVSDLAQHTAALAARPEAAVMLGEVGARGDPLTHPRLMVKVAAQAVDRGGPGHAALRAKWLDRHPKARLYIDFADFRFVRLVPVSALLNAGFGRAYRLAPRDLWDGAEP